MSSKLTIPDPNIRTRIVGTHARKVLYSHMRDSKALSQVDMAGVYDDQYWYIKPGHGEHEGRYQIVSDYTKRCLYVNFRNGQWGDVGTVEPVGSYADQYFDLLGEQGQGTKGGQFRVHASAGDGVLFLRKAPKPEIGCISYSRNKSYDDQWFTFELEPLEMTGITFDVQNAVIQSTQPRGIFTQKSKNSSDTQQNPSVSFNETVEEQATFESEVGLEIGASTSFSSGVPILAEGKVEVSAKVHTNLKWGRTNTTSHTFAANVPLSVPPHTTLMVTATVTESILSVPFTTTWKSLKTGNTMTAKGVFKGLSCADLATSYYPVDK
jgi:hypothetical protein